MRPTSCNLKWFAAAVCVLAGSGFAVAQQGVVRISDTGQTPSSGAVVRMSDFRGDAIQPTAYTAGGCATGACVPQGCAVSVMDGCGCNAGAVCGCNSCQCNSCQSCDTCYYGDGYGQRMCTLFAGSNCSTCPGSGCPAKNWYRCQQANYFARNQRLADCLFGWMIPSGCCGQGCPPVGKYQVTYAEQPDYADSRDGQLYSAQGYGMPVTVPTAPVVRYSYNYSWGTPASRLTPLSTYNPQTSTQPLYHQSW
jgi:hypothetical protein